MHVFESGRAAVICSVMHYQLLNMGNAVMILDNLSRPISCETASEQVLVRKSLRGAPSSSRRLLGYTPRVSSSDGLARFTDWVQSQLIELDESRDALTALAGLWLGKQS